MEAVYAYYDNSPVVLTTDQDRFIYVRRMTNTRSSITKIITIEHKKSWIATEMNDIPVNCSMYVCCDDYVVYSNQNINADYDSVMQRVNADPYVTVEEYEKFGTTFKIYAFTDDIALASVLKNNLPALLIIVVFTLLFPILIMNKHS